MKRLVFSFFMFISLFAKAQLSNVVVYTELGERFSLALNGVIQNALPGNNIRLTGVMPGSYNMSMIFEMQILGTVNWNLMVEPNAEATYCARRMPSGEWMVRLLSVVPMAQMVQTLVPNQSTIIYHTAPLPGATTTTTTTTYYDDPFFNDNVNVNFGINGIGMNMNINGNFTETTTTQTTTYVNPGFQQTVVQNPGFPNQTIVYEQPVPASPAYVMPGYAGPVGCAFPMDPVSFADAKNSIATKGFESTRLQVAQQITQSRCMTSAQVREIMGLFSFESTKLEYAKFAYRYTYDIGNYYMVNDAFGFASSIDDLNRFLNGGR